MDAKVVPLDFHRMFLGDLPPTIYVEMLIRTVVLYGYTLLVVRVLGKRARAEMTPFEFIVLIALGSAVGDPLFYPEVPILHCLFVITIVVLLQRALVRATEEAPRLEAFLESAPRCLVRRGVIDLAALSEESLSRAELFSGLREAGIEQLGEVRWVHLEPSGRLSVARERDDVSPGLSILPRREEGTLGPGHEAAAGAWACASCGEVIRLGERTVLPPCPRCHAGCWVEPVAPAPGGISERG